MTQAVPAIVWNKSHPQQHNRGDVSVSNDVSLEQLLMMESSISLESTGIDDTNNLFTVMFLLERDSKTGQDSLTSMTPLLQQTLSLQQQNQQSYYSPKQYLHISGIESKSNVLNQIKRVSSSSSITSTSVEPVLVNMNELSYKLNTTVRSVNEDSAVVMDVTGVSSSNTMTLPASGKAAVKRSKRIRSIDASNFLIVTIPDTIDIEIFDATLVQTLQHTSVTMVLVSAVRGVAEVKYEREMKMRRQLLDKAILVGSSSKTTAASSSDPYHRRLDEGNGDGGDGDNSNLSGVYYVHMTPNILSGLLFFGLFTVVAMIGFSCMNMISGQDVYVNTMPSIGREA